MLGVYKGASQSNGYGEDLIEDFGEGGLAPLLAATTPLPAATPAPLHPAATTTTTAAWAVTMYGTPNKDYLHYYTAVTIVLTILPPGSTLSKGSFNFSNGRSARMEGGHE